MKKIILLLFLFCYGFAQAQLEIPGQIVNKNNKPLEKWYYNPATLLPWADIATILANAERQEGRLFYVSGGDVYTFKGGILDANLALFGASGNVNTGTVNQVAVYAATGNTVSGSTGLTFDGTVLRSRTTDPNVGQSFVIENTNTGTGGLTQGISISNNLTSGFPNQIISLSGRGSQRFEMGGDGDKTIRLGTATNSGTRSIILDGSSGARTITLNGTTAALELNGGSTSVITLGGTSRINALGFLSLQQNGSTTIQLGSGNSITLPNALTTDNTVTSVMARNASGVLVERTVASIGGGTSGTVNNGTINRLAFYPATGTAVSSSTLEYTTSSNDNILRFPVTIASGASFTNFTNDVGTAVEFGIFGSTRSGGGVIGTGGSYLYSNSDFNIAANTGSIKFGTGTGYPEVARFNTTGQFLVGGTTASSSQSLVEFKSTNKGVIFPNATRAAITGNPQNMLIGEAGTPYWNNGTSWISLAGGAGVSTFSAGTTGLTPSTETSGAVTLAGTLGIGNGGTNATTAQGAINNLAGAVTAGSYLRGNGTNVVMSAIQAADVPILNQNSLGSSATLTTGRTIALTGDVTYTSPTFNGSANVTATATVTRINGTALSGLATGLLKNTTTTGVPSIAVASDIATAIGSQAANLHYASPDGAAGTPIFRKVVSADLQNVTGSGTIIPLATSPTISTSLVAGTSSFDLLNFVVTNLNFAGAATNFNLGGTPTTSLTATLFGNATASGQTKTISIGTGGVAGSTTNINLGSSSGGTFTVKGNTGTFPDLTWDAASSTSSLGFALAYSFKASSAAGMHFGTIAGSLSANFGANNTTFMSIASAGKITFFPTTNRHLAVLGAAPSLVTSVGISGLTITGNDTKGKLSFTSTTTGLSTIVLNFASAYDSTPVVVLTGSRDAMDLRVTSTSTTAFGISFNSNFSGSTGEINYVIIE